MAQRIKLLTEPWHLAARFARSLSPAPPSIEAEMWADDHLLPGERRLWIRLSNQDRRHSVAVAQRFAERRPDAGRAEIAGALLHDVGKIDCDLGTFGRVAATLVGPRWSDRFRSYHDHEAIGAAMVEAAGSDPATVELVDERGDAAEDLGLVDY